MAPKSTATRESLFVRILDEDNNPVFVNVTRQIGQDMPFKKPQALCAMRVTEQSVAFSMLHLTKKTQVKLAASKLDMPRGPLMRLERHARTQNAILPGHLCVVIGDESYLFELELDDAGVARLAEQDEETVIDLPITGLKIDFYMLAPKVDRLVTYGFVGHLGKPGGTESVRRAASMALNSATGLPEFRIITGIETVSVPSAVRGKATPSARQLAAIPTHCDQVVPVWLFTEPDANGTAQPLASGNVLVSVDLENANPSTDRLLCHFTPDAALVDLFPTYRNALDKAIAGILSQQLGDEQIQDIVYDIVLGGVDERTGIRVSEALAEVGGWMLTPSRFAPSQP